MAKLRPFDITPERAFLLVVGVGILAYAAAPGVGSYQPPQGAIVGTVLDSLGQPVADLPVALFRDPSLDLAELTHSDARGNFALQQMPAAFHVLARPQEGRGLVGSWLFDLAGGRDHELRIVLEEGVPLTVSTVDPDGAPIEGAEVRAFRDPSNAQGPLSLVASTWTDASGQASLLAPPRLHLGALAEGFQPAWSFGLVVAEDGGADGVVELVLTPAD